MSIVSSSTYVDWSKSDTPADEAWKNRTRSNRENILVADAAIHERDLTIADLRKKIAELIQDSTVEPIKLWGDSSEPNILKRGLVDAHGRKYELMSGTISVCNFVGFKKLLDAGLVLRATEMPIDENGKTFCKIEVAEATPDLVAAIHAEVQPTNGELH